MKKSSCLLSVCAILSASLIASSAQAKVTLRALTCYPSNAPQEVDYKLFLKMVNETGGGVVQIQPIGGPEVIPATESGTALSNGLFDVLFCPPSYYAGRFPEAWAFAAKLLPADEVRRRGGVEIYDKPLNEKMNAKFIAFADGAAGLTTFSSRKIALREDGLPDLTGHRLRTAITYTPLFKALGGTPITMPPGDVYTGLERGLIDGTGFNILGVDTLGWDKFLKYIVLPPMQKGSTIVSMNLKKYNSLSDEEKAALRDVAPKYEAALEKQIATLEREAADKYRKNGMTIVQLSPEAGQKFQSLWLEEYWKVVESTKGLTSDLGAIRKSFAGP
ncbi:TRAP transporter substrate-binding protein DctP [Microvirga zambiensis]|uniref:TRAP transporter substrate-binding protein DctP n=1 Tax=Microvirga zambiensis TaxID=1402137 RepID=UPI00191D7A89|nr:TRAP transporter substrate-binding protein DctP [Microvirga zambiensis]